MKEIVVTKKYGYVTAISGLFISKDFPSGLTAKEIVIFTVLWNVMEYRNENKITIEVKKQAAEILHISMQVLTNYMVKLRKKKLLTQDNMLNKVFTNPNISISLINNKQD